MMNQLLRLFVLLTPGALSAQTLQVTATAGQELHNERYRISATVGEPCVTTQRAADGHFATEGFQQGEVRGATTAIPAVPEQSGTLPGATLHPNPASDHLILSAPNPTAAVRRIRIFDSAGRQVWTTDTADAQYRCDVSTLMPGHYWLLVEAPETTTPSRLPFEKI